MDGFVLQADGISEFVLEVEGIDNSVLVREAEGMDESEAEGNGCV
jgi:hypothetical protein